MTQIIRKGWGEGDVPSQVGKVAFITGASNGLGYEASRILSSKGARVLMACRDAERAKAAVAGIIGRNATAHIDVIDLDLADLDSVSGVAGQVRALGVDQIDILLNNAGVMMPPKRQVTRQGFEVQFGTNHLGHFALTRSLFDLLSPQSRIVNVASIADRRGDINWDDLQWERSYNPSAAYGQSKTANLLFNLALTERLKAAGSAICAVAAHPGIAMTNLATTSTMGPMLRLIKPLIALGLGPKVQQPAMGVLPEIYGATGDIEPGAYYGPEHKIHGHPIRAEAHKAAHSNDTMAAARLWALSETLTGGRFII